MALPLRDIIPPFLKCVEAVLRGDDLEASDISSVAVANLKSGLNQLVNPEGESGLSDVALRALESASKMQFKTEANVKIVSELLLPLMKGFCVFNAHHRKALHKVNAPDSRLCLLPSLGWKGLALGSPKIWYGELDMLLCPDVGSGQESGHFPVAVVQQGKDFPDVSLAVEGKKRLRTSWSLLGKKTPFSQAYATAIVFSYLCHYKFGMKRSFIPTLLISPQAFVAFFYDCKEDIMISKYCLWTEYTLVFLWTVLHYPAFYPPSWEDLGIEGVPFGYLDNLPDDSRLLHEEEFYFGESLQSPVFKRMSPFLGRPTCDWRTKPDRGILLSKPKYKKDH